MCTQPRFGEEGVEGCDTDTRPLEGNRAVFRKPKKGLLLAVNQIIGCNRFLVVFACFLHALYCPVSVHHVCTMYKAVMGSYNRHLLLLNGPPHPPQPIVDRFWDCFSYPGVGGSAGEGGEVHLPRRRSPPRKTRQMNTQFVFRV